MSSESTQRTLLLEQIAIIVADAERDGRIISTARHAARLFASFPGANFSIGRIIDELVLAASSRRVALEITRPGRDE